MRHRLLIICFILISSCATAQFQGVVVNEISQGADGKMEYIELMVVGKKTCISNSVNLSGWIIDDHNGRYGISGDNKDNSSPGHIRFAKSSILWQNVPFGTIIVIYNEKSSITKFAGEVIDTVNNKYILPSTSGQLEYNFSFPYPDPATYPFYSNSGSKWNYIELDDKADAIIIIDPNNFNKAHFSLAYGLSGGIKSQNVSIPSNFINGNSYNI